MLRATVAVVKSINNAAYCLQKDRKKRIKNTLTSQIKTLPELQPIADELAQLKSVHDMPRRIELCRQALNLVSRERYPASWASLQNELGKSLFQNLQGDQADNLEQAIFSFQKALEVCTRQNFPTEWSQTMSNLAVAYQNRIQGKKAENIERAIEIYHQALQVMFPNTMPIDWIRTIMNLGTAFADRIEGNRAENLEQAITLYKQALDVATDNKAKAEWGQILVNLAMAYANRLRGDRVENFELAIRTSEQALEVFTPESTPIEWAKTKVNLANVYSDRIKGKRLENLEKATSNYRQALEIMTQEAMPYDFATVMTNLAALYIDQALRYQAENLELAISACQQALQVRTRQTAPTKWARTVSKLANAYAYRIHGDKAESLEKAIEYYFQVLEVITPESLPVEWAGIMHNLAIVYAARIPFLSEDDRSENRDQAIAAFQNALKTRTLEHFPIAHRQTQRSLGDLYFYEQNWSAAHQAYAGAIEAGNALFAAAYSEVGRQTEVSETARLYAAAAYCLLQMGQPVQAFLQLEQGKTRLLAEALALAEVDLSILPGDQQQALQTARNSVHSLEAEMRLPPDTPARRDDRELAEALRLARRELNGLIEQLRAEHPGFMTLGLDLPDILALIPPNGALVAPLITPQGSTVFVIPHGVDAITIEHIIQLDDFTGKELSVLLVGDDANGWLPAYLNLKNGGLLPDWKATIEAITNQLWQFLIGPIHERLQTIGMPTGTSVILMPHSGLGFLPLHAAWREVDGLKRAFLDDYIVSYAPSAYSLSVSHSRLQRDERLKRSLLAVVNPTGDLDYTNIEGEAVAALFDAEAKQILLENEATPSAIMQAASGLTYLHFAGHGLYDWQDIMKSGLVLADGATMTLSEIIISLTLDITRLVTLSACETGLTGIWQSFDEYVGLPAGFLQAGAPGVVSTLWAVDDLSTMLLMERFYEYHLQHGMEIAAALRQAQLWLRDVTAAELSERFSAERQVLLGSIRMSTEVVSREFRRFAMLNPDERPFAHPFYWAPFIFSGA